MVTDDHVGYANISYMVRVMKFSKSVILRSMVELNHEGNVSEML